MDRERIFVDENEIEDLGVIQDTIRIYWIGVCIGTMQLEIRVDRQETDDKCDPKRSPR